MPFKRDSRSNVRFQQLWIPAPFCHMPVFTLLISAGSSEILIKCPDVDFEAAGHPDVKVLFMLEQDIPNNVHGNTESGPL